MSFSPRYGIAASVILILLLIVSVPRESFLFQKLKWYRDNNAEATRLATNLRTSPKGISLALQDIDCFGGETGGWSAWILETTFLSTMVETNLTKILKDSEFSLSKRIEAAWILWKRTADPTWLKELFILVQHKGPPSILIGRRLLNSAIVSDNIGSQINSNASFDLGIPLDQFSEWINMTNALRRPVDTPDHVSK